MLVMEHKQNFLFIALKFTYVASRNETSMTPRAGSRIRQEFCIPLSKAVTSLPWIGAHLLKNKFVQQTL